MHSALGWGWWGRGLSLLGVDNLVAVWIVVEVVALPVVDWNSFVVV